MNIQHLSMYIFPENSIVDITGKSKRKGRKEAKTRFFKEYRRILQDFKERVKRPDQRFIKNGCDTFVMLYVNGVFPENDRRELWTKRKDRDILPSQRSLQN